MKPSGSKAILEIHLRERGLPVTAHLDRAGNAATGFVGAELEAVVIEALFTAFDEGHPGNAPLPSKQ